MNFTGRLLPILLAGLLLSQPSYAQPGGSRAELEGMFADSLLKRSTELTAFAKNHHLGSYDGIDVGPASTR